MALISEKSHKNKLKELGINIKTTYIVGNNLLEKNTDDCKNDDINNGVRCLKEYFRDNKLIHRENSFDTRIEYTYLSNQLSSESHTCTNCGYSSKVSEFIDGCPYCRTNLNIDYIEIIVLVLW